MCLAFPVRMKWRKCHDGRKGDVRWFHKARCEICDAVLYSSSVLCPPPPLCQFQVVWVQPVSVHAGCVAQRQSCVGSQSSLRLPLHLPASAQLPAEQRCSAGAVGTSRWEEMDELLGEIFIYCIFHLKQKKPKNPKPTKNAYLMVVINALFHSSR